MVAVVGTDNLFVLLIGWEVMGVCSYLLIGHHWEREDAQSGAVKALLVTRAASNRSALHSVGVGALA